MASRLVDLYPVEAKVEIKLPDDIWRPGVVFRHAHPGVWVRLANGSDWFVTNGQNIRAILPRKDHV